MECSAIKLINRRDVKHTKITNRKQCEERPMFSADCLHRLYVQKKDDQETKSLNVKILQLPENLKMFNTGASMEKWCQKRPRLKSTKKLDKFDEKSDEIFEEKFNERSDDKLDANVVMDRKNVRIIEMNEIVDDFSGSSIINNYNNNDTQVVVVNGEGSHCCIINKDIADPFNKHCIRPANLDDYDIDSDVEKLIAQFIKQPEDTIPINNDNNNNKQKTRKKERRRRKRHNIFNGNKMKKDKNNTNTNNNNNKSKLKRKGIIRYTSIKPPSPSTLEVIRVNVTSNYYNLQEQRRENRGDENNNDNKHHQDCVKVNGRFKFCFTANKTNRDETKEVDEKFEVDCKKLVLSYRNNIDKIK